MTEFKLPELGEGVAGGDVTRVLVNVGDTLAREQGVVELETDKATIEVPSSVAGVVKEIKVKKGDKLTVGQVVLTVDDGAGAEPSKPAATAAAAPAPAAAPGPATAAAPAATEPTPSAAPASAPAPAAEARPQEHKVITMPSRVAAAEPAPAQPAQPAAAAPAPRGDRGPAPASPGVRRLAREIGVDVHEVMGTGPNGRITQDDVKEHARRILTSVGSAIAAAPSQARATRALPDFTKFGAVDRQPWSNIRRSTSEHLSHAWNSIPHVTQFDKADFTAMEELRKKYKDQVAAAGGSLTVTAILVRVLAAAVQKFPQLNASIDTERGEIVYKKYVNIGVAVDTERGLLVPVIRNADTKNITRLAVELNELAAKARDKKLTPDDMSGGGITISNLGGIGGTHFTPIVNWPEVAILGVSRGVMEPVWVPASGGGAGARAGSFEPRLMLPLSLSYDHRLVDGADAMRFLRWVVEAIEQPFLLSLIG